MNLKGRITVYSVVGCPSCMGAKNTLQEKGLPFTDVNLDAFPHLHEYLRATIGTVTVPQIFFNNIHVGGKDALEEKFSDKQEYESLLAEVKNNEVPPDAPKVPDANSAVRSADVMDFTREPDEYGKLVADLKRSGVIKNHPYSATYVHKNSFTGKDFVDWLVKTKGLEDDSAVEMGQQLISRHFCHRIDGPGEQFYVSSYAFYRLLEDEETAALNGGETSQYQPRKATEVAEDMRRLIINLYSAFLSPDGRRVDYNGIASSADLQKYLILAQELVRVNVETLTRDEKLAFFINIYNALVIHGKVMCGHPSSSYQIDRFFLTVKYIIGGQQYSLDDIENGVLRANRKGAGKHFLPFGENDPRLKVSLEYPEPLIHFALVCGAKSCPPIRTFSPQDVKNQLETATEAFFEGDDAVSVDLPNKTVTLSQIFEWYQVDFGNNRDEVLEFIHSHMGESDKKTNLRKLLQSEDYILNYHPYDWSINSQ